MVSPFYLGSNPADDAAGQYPGKAISGGGNRFTAPPEFINLADDFDVMWDKVVGEGKNATVDLPRLFIEEQKKAWKSVFTVSGGFEGYVETDPYLRELSGDDEQFYKAADFKIDLLQVFKDPKSTLLDIKKATINAEDMRREGRERLMKALVLGTGVSHSGSWQDNLLDASLKSFDERYQAKQERAGLIDRNNRGAATPLSVMDNPDVVYHIEEQATFNSLNRRGPKRVVRTDSRSKFGSAVVEWTRKEDGLNNSPAFRKFVSQAGVSIADILEDSNSGGPDVLIENVLARQNLVGTPQYGAAKAQLQDAYARFAKMQKAESGIGKFFGGKNSVYGKASNALTSLDAARIVPGIPGVPVDIGSLASDLEHTNVASTLKALANPLADMALNVRNVEQSYLGTPYISAAERARVQKWAAKMNKQITDLASSTGSKLTAADLARLKSSNDIAGLASFASAFESAAANTAKRRSVGGALSKFNFALGGANDFQTGLNTELSKILVDHHIVPNRNIAGFSSVGTIVGETVFGRQIKMHTLAVRDSYRLNYASNMFSSVQGGKITSGIFKTRFINALPDRTPQKIVKRFLTANHYFGLRVDQTTLESYENWVAAGRPGKQFSGFYKPGNRFVTSKTFGALFKNKFTIDLGIPGIGKISATGGSHFDAVSILNPFRTSFGQDELKRLLRDGISAADPRFAMHNAMLAELNGLMTQYGLTESQAFITLLMRTSDNARFKEMFGHMPIGKLDEVFLKVGGFRNWLIDNKFDVFDAHGNFDPNKMGNLDHLLTWFQKRSANPSYLAITSGTVGLVEKLTERLNLVQDRIFNFEKFGFKFGRLFFWQQQMTALLYNKFLALIDRLIARLTSKAVTGFLVSATGGLAGFIAPLIDKFIYFIAVNITSKLSGALKGILKGDFASLGYALQNATTAVIKIAAYTTLVVALILLIPLGVLGFLTKNMSPKAPYAYNTGQAGLPVDVVEGGAILPNACANRCILQNGGTSFEISYSGNDTLGDGAYGHGSNAYWRTLIDEYGYDSQCNLLVPLIDIGGGAAGPTESLDSAGGDTNNNYCSENGESPGGTYSDNYGKAWDISSAAGNVVCAPALGDVSYWVVGTTTTDGMGDGGAMMDLAGFDSSDNLIYNMNLLHLNPDEAEVAAAGTRVEPGDGLARVFNWEVDGGRNISHLHVELKDSVNNSVLAPETHLQAEDKGICF